MKLNPNIRGIPPKKAPKELATLKAACINEAANISEFFAFLTITIFIGVPIDMAKTPQIKVKITDVIWFCDKKNTKIKEKTIKSYSQV